MRSLTKEPIPQILADNVDRWTEDFLGDQKNGTKKYRYRHPDIKETLKKETTNKCIYCESKIGHNTPGDVEHKVPSSVDRTIHFDWQNLTIACTECNRRKNNYYSDDTPFLDPYVDNVEEMLVHHGPIVGWMPGVERAEATIRVLEIHDGSRDQLILRKIEKIEEINGIHARMAGKTSPLMTELLMRRLDEMCSVESEYSGMATSVCKRLVSEAPCAANAEATSAN